MAVEFGIQLGINAVGAPAPDRLAYYRRCLQAGDGALRALWLSDHLQKDDRPVFEGWTTLSYLAALAPSYRVGTMVLGQSYRNPALLAKMAATLQNLTGGRLVLGIGAGWQEDEYAAYNFPFPSAGQRIEQLAEAVDVMRAMWASSPATYEGKHYAVHDAYCLPQPSPPPTVLIGGQGPKLLRVAAAKADAWSWDGPLEMFAPPYQRLVDSCEQLGRPLSEIKLVAGFEAYFPADLADFPEPEWSGYQDFMVTPLGPTPAEARRELDRLLEIGVEEFAIYFHDLRSLERFVQEVVPEFP